MNIFVVDDDRQLQKVMQVSDAGARGSREEQTRGARLRRRLRLCSLRAVPSPSDCCSQVGNGASVGRPVPGPLRGAWRVLFLPHGPHITDRFPGARS